MVTTELVPPDGGYGWVIVFSFALNNIIVIPIMQGFGLVFKDKFKDLGFTAADTSLIMNSSSAIAMLCGLFNVPLLKQFGYRKVGLLSASFIAVGVFLTGYANTVLEFIVTYGLITSYGLGMGMSAYTLAINSYFKKRRAKAVGYAMAISGIGPIIMPQILSFLLWQYGVSGALMIVAGLSCHIFVSAILLQPVKWHMKKVFVEDEDEEESDKLLQQETKDVKNNPMDKSLAASKQSLDNEIEVEELYNIDTTLGGSVLSLYVNDLPQRSMSVTSRTKSIKSKYSVKEDGNNVNIVVTPPDAKDHKKEDLNKNQETEKEKPTILKRIGNYLVETFDLSLLKDPTYVNIMVGMSFAVFAEMNFSLLTPFIMQDYGLDTQQIATFMSVISIADVCFRFIAPYVSDYFKKPVRIMYLWALAMLMSARTTLLFTNNYYGLLACALFLGIAKGFRTVYWTLVIPDYVPLEKLPGATGIQSTFNSIFMWLGGSALGYVRDAVGSFRYCIVLINGMTFITISMWTIEIMYKKMKAKSKAQEGENIK